MWMGKTHEPSTLHKRLQAAKERSEWENTVIQYQTLPWKQTYK